MEASLTYSLFLVIMVCSADNELQQGSKSRTEDFMPRIIEHPSDLVVRRDQPGIVNCRAEGNPEPTIEWHRNGESVNFSKGHNSLIPGGSLFFLHFKGRSDEGVYTCLARNHLGTAVSRNASLTIAVLKDEFRQEPLDKVVIAGRPLVIDCSPPKGYPEPVVTWRKNGALLHRNNTRYMFAAGRLSIARALSSDAGVYMCVASNQADERTSRGAVISVLEIPQFTNKPADVVAKLGSTVQFACGAQGNPKPIVQWSKEKGVLPTGRYAITNENTLCLQRVTVQDSGTYVCTARSNIGAVSASAQLMVQDPLDTGQILQELSKVKLYLDSVTLHNSSSVRIQWKAYSSSQYTEGYTLLYRLHTTSDSDWEKWGVIPVNENTAVISGLHKGQKYEFKVRPYGWNVYGMDSNIRHVLIPEDVPGPAPQDVNITLANGRNGSIIVNWEPPPPQGVHGGYIKAYKVWCIGNETLPQSNWTVDSGTRSLEIPLLPAGIKYQVQVAALYDSGMGKLSNPQYILIETPMMKENTPDGMIPLDLLLQVIKHPAFIATMGGATWLMLMVAVIYLCQRNSKRYSKKKHSGLYRFASEDTIIKHRMDTSDSPWLSNTWRSASCSRNYSSTTSMDSHLLWMENKDTTDFHKSTISFERKSEGSRSQIIPLVPDSSMYGALHVDLPGKDLTTFQCPSPVRPPGMGISSKSGIHLGLYDHNLFPHCHGSVNNLTPGGARSKIPGKPVVLVPPNVAIKEPWRHNLKRELHHVNSAPLSHFVQTDSGSVPSVKSLDGNPSGKGEYAKVMKTFSSPKILHYTTSLKVMDILPYSNPLPPPPAPPPEEEPSRDGLDKPVPKMMTDPQQDNGHKPTHFSKKKSPPDSLLFRQMSSLSIHDDTVLTPEDIAHYLEFNGQGDHTRRMSESDSTLPLPFSTSSNTYGYICSPSELAEVDAADEDDDLDLGELSSLKSYRKYCETPTSSISEYESSMAGSLVNGWGSVSEDNYTSARCSMVSSSDGSFLMDASFAKALAVAVDSFCLGITQSESVGVERISSDFSPSASPLDGLLAAQNQGDGTDLNSRKPKVNPLPVLDWNIDWMDELEAKYRHRSQTKPPYPFSKKVEPFK